ncbi:DUF3592 domain-containing protein [Rhodobacter sp. NTK016B]|uniref:DUF3592 domain-containing protein n=1 Tax=Rhodobacter sp. NTK016B TaxID=2759676 RepID=UPI001A90172E|nr:DUF3592 domain-containing protein [Rhodobacter sp. NTK016B]MBN8294159.1 DUF3592 domain-containing protein [Rhodobacter sp. NTK016B]
MTDTDPATRPRPDMSRRSYTRHDAFVAVLLFGVLGLAGLLWSAWYVVEDSVIARDGVLTTATVTDRQIETLRNRNGTNGRRYTLSVTYTDNDGAVHEQAFSVTSDYYLGEGSADTIALRYSRAAPDIAQIEPAQDRRRAAIAGAGGLISALVALIYGLLIRRELASQRRAVQDGPRLLARVTQRMTHGRKTLDQWRIRWETEDGLTGLSRGHPSADVPEPGTIVAVYRDPVSGKGWWHGDY